MPYITQKNRDQVNDLMSAILDYLTLLSDIEQIKFVSDYIKKLHQEIRTRDLQKLYESSGNFNYCITTVCWGILGDDPRFESNYSKRSYLNGTIRNIISDIEVETQNDIIFIGILEDVLAEIYRRKMSAYEDGKMKLNGDIFPLGE